MSAGTNQGSAAAPLEGDVLAGKYRVEKILGKGGMGVVVAAMHLHLGQRVAIKYLYQPDNAEIVARFLREARAAVRLRSEHVARIIDVGELENGAPYMVMEYLDGNDLQQEVKRNGPLPVHDAVAYLLQTCEAIAEAHALGIVHRDLKPANLFLSRTPDGGRCLKVLDFGISKTNEGEGEGDGMQLTQTTAMLGSPLYMSPEQIKSSKNVDARSDVWSLGTILYQVLAGQVPFQCNSYSELVLKVNLDEPPSLIAVRPDVPPALEAAIFGCLQKKRDDRTQNVAALAFAIAEFGPPTGRASAEKCARVLEASGATIERPTGVTDVAGYPPTSAISTSQSASTPAGLSVGSTTASGGAVATTAMVAGVGGTASSEGTSTNKSRMGFVVALAVVGLGLVATTGALLMRSSSTVAVPTTASVTPVTASAMPGSSLSTTATIVPVAAPVVDASAAAASAAAASAAAPPASASATTGPGSAVKATTTTTITTTKKKSPPGNNPLDMSPY